MSRRKQDDQRAARHFWETAVLALLRADFAQNDVADIADSLLAARNERFAAPVNSPTNTPAPEPAPQQPDFSGEIDDVRLAVESVAHMQTTLARNIIPAMSARIDRFEAATTGAVCSIRERLNSLERQAPPNGGGL